MSDRILYVLHPGMVQSRNDGDFHYIDEAALLRLYNVQLSYNKKVISTGNHQHSREFQTQRYMAQAAVFKATEDGVKVVHLKPRSSGNYTLEDV